MSDLLALLNHLFGDRYGFRREIGSGSVGSVFLARDRRYARNVAVKVIRAEKAGKKVARRFLKEIEIAAGLLHPNIMPVFDSGEREGIAFFVMPYAEDGSLRHLLVARGALPVPDATRIASEVLEALECAHDHGVVHLDVKPENILLTTGHALLGDFGVSRATADVQSWGFWAKETPVGTPEYMCPEHASRKSRQDPRSDIYSLGCVLYEMLAGTPPFQGPTERAVLRKHQTESPFPLTSRPTVSPALDRSVRKALEKEAADRHQDAAAFLRTLRVDTVAETEAKERGPRFEPTSREGTMSVWVVEDQPGPRAEIKALLDRAEGVACPRAFESGEALMDVLKTDWPPDVVVMDIGLPGMSGIDATERLKRSWPGTHVVVLSVHEDFDRVFKAFQAGAISYLDKGASEGEILRAVRLAPRGGCVMTPPIARRVRSMFSQAPEASWAYRLSGEDTELLSQLAEGRQVEDIAERLGLDVEAVEARMRLVHAKLHVNQGLPSG